MARTACAWTETSASSYHVACGSRIAQLGDSRPAQGSEAGLGPGDSRQPAVGAGGGDAVLAPPAARPAGPGRCHPPGLVRKGRVNRESHLKTQCALKEMNTILYFCEMVLVVLHVFHPLSWRSRESVSGVRNVTGDAALHRAQSCASSWNHVQTLNVIYVVFVCHFR